MAKPLQQVQSSLTGNCSTLLITEAIERERRGSSGFQCWRPQVSVLSLHVCCSCWRCWKALWVMLRPGWTFFRLGSPIRDRPQSPKYAWRGSDREEERLKEWKEETRSEMITCITAQTPVCDRSVAFAVLVHWLMTPEEKNGSHFCSVSFLLLKHELWP